MPTAPRPDWTPLAGETDVPFQLQVPFPAQFGGAVLNRLPPGPLDCPAGWQKIEHLEWGFGYCLPPGVPHYSGAWGDALNTTWPNANLSLLLLPAQPRSPRPIEDISCATRGGGFRPRVAQMATERLGSASYELCYYANGTDEPGALTGGVRAFFVTPRGYLVSAYSTVCVGDLPPLPAFAGLKPYPGQQPHCPEWRTNVGILRQVIPTLRAVQ